MNDSGTSYLEEFREHFRTHTTATGLGPQNISDADLEHLLKTYLHGFVFYNDTKIPNRAHPHFNGTIWEYLEIAGHGPRRGPIDTVIAITCVYGFIFLSGIFGNVCTCIVIARNKYMHTATNFYLFNLAIADILLLIIGLPPETYLVWSAYPWIFGKAFCIIRTMLAEMSTNASILTITAFTVERYVAICHPLKVHKLSGLKRVMRVIACIWLLACLFSIPLTLQFKLVYVLDNKNQPIYESAVCSVSEENFIARTFEVSTFLFFVFPMSLVTVMYTFIALAIRKSGLYREGSDSSGRDRLNVTEAFSQQVRARRSVVKMLVAVVFGFFICWAPFHTQRLMTLYIPAVQWTDNLLYIHKVIYYISGVCYFMSCTINPVLYSIMSLKFRQAFRQTLCRSKCCHKRMRKTRKKAYFSCRFSRKNGFSETSFTSVGPVSPNRCADIQKTESSSDRLRSEDPVLASRSILHSPEINGKSPRIDIRKFVFDINKDPTVDANRNKAVDNFKLDDIPEVLNEGQSDVT